MNIPYKVFETPEVKPFKFSSSKEVYENMKDYSKASREIFLVLHMNAKNNLIECETQGIGTVDCSAVYPREVVKSAVMFGASSIICIHNHPSGDPTPSEADNQITRQLLYGCMFMGLKMLDHIIIGKDKYYSYADSGLLDEYERRFKSSFDFNLNI